MMVPFSWHPNSKLPEEKHIFSINDTIFTNGLGTVSTHTHLGKVLYCKEL